MLPLLKSKPQKARRSTMAFGGLNLNYITRDGDLVDSGNLSCRDFPCLKNAAVDRPVEGHSGAEQIFYDKGFFSLRGGSLYFEGEFIAPLSRGEKQFIPFGKQLLIFPDQKRFVFATKTLADLCPKQLLASASFSGGNLTLPTGMAAGFKSGQSIAIRGCAMEENNGLTTIVGISGNVLRTDRVFRVFTAAANTVSVQLRLPDFSQLCVSGNRLWGTVGSTIYGSKVGAPHEFYAFQGLFGDSYTLDVVSDGDFTACIPFSGYLLFFKEQMIYKLMGTKPANYQLLTLPGSGVRTGCHGSLAFVGDGLVYYSPLGFQYYRGGTAEKFSHALGSMGFKNVRAQVKGAMYYFYGELGGSSALYAYDMERQVFLKQSAPELRGFVGGLEGAAYFTPQGLFEIGTGEADSRFMLEFAPFLEGFSGKISYSSFTLIAEITRGSYFKVEASLDGGPYYSVLHASDYTRRSFFIPLLPNVTGGIRLKISGFGRFCLQNMIREVSPA